MGSMSWMGITRVLRLAILIICGRYYTFYLSENQFVFIIRYGLHVRFVQENHTVSLDNMNNALVVRKRKQNMKYCQLCKQYNHMFPCIIGKTTDKTLISAHLLIGEIKKLVYRWITAVQTHTLRSYLLLERLS